MTSMPSVISGDIASLAQHACSPAWMNDEDNKGSANCQHHSGWAISAIERDHCLGELTALAQDAWELV